MKNKQTDATIKVRESVCVKERGGKKLRYCYQEKDDKKKKNSTNVSNMGCACMLVLSH